jgi:hypothetical protein
MRVLLTLSALTIGVFGLAAATAGEYNPIVRHPVSFDSTARCPYRQRGNAHPRTHHRNISTPVPDASAKPGSPLIRRVALNKHHYSSHDQIRMQVTTTRDVVKVTNHELGHGGILRKVSPGVFFGSGRVSGIPFFLKGMHCWPPPHRRARQSLEQRKCNAIVMRC